MARRVRLTAAVILFVTAFSTPATGADFYRGKMLRFIVGFSAGGGFDVYTRAIARHIGKHIDGNPSTLVQNMPGAGSLIAGNYIYNKAKPDGLTVGNWIGQLVLQQVLGGRSGIKFDGRKFGWIGTPVPNYIACALSRTSGVETLEQWRASKKPVKLGGTAPGDGTVDLPKMLKTALGLPIQVIEGYGGTSKIQLAVEAGEVHGGCWTWDVMKRFWQKKFESGEMNVVLQANAKKPPDLLAVPNAIDHARTEEGRELIQVAIHGGLAILRPYSAPPGTPRERVEILRRAFMATMSDPEFLAETKRAGLAVEPLTGEEVERIVDGFFELKPELLAKLKQILAPEKR